MYNILLCVMNSFIQGFYEGFLVFLSNLFYYSAIIQKVMERNIWNEIEELCQEFQKLGISQSVDYEKYYLYSLIAHSTAIDGSTLTEMDIQLLFDERAMRI